MKPFIWFRRGATAYEAQFGSCVVRIVHLSGDHLRFKPWRRLSIRFYKDYS